MEVKKQHGAELDIIVEESIFQCPLQGSRISETAIMWLALDPPMLSFSMRKLLNIVVRVAVLFRSFTGDNYVYVLFSLNTAKKKYSGADQGTKGWVDL